MTYLCIDFAPPISNVLQIKPVDVTFTLFVNSKRMEEHILCSIPPKGIDVSPYFDALLQAYLVVVAGVDAAH